MPGSAVRAGNIIELATKTGAVEFHTSARMHVNSKMDYVNKAMKENLKSVAADEEEIKNIMANLKSL
jgi:copper homeostasis protein